ncbi:MAG: universal stress protein [Deltaproteobacteria bacterium]|nr:universal stress protein [Deltaproteobacteria bacterium]
MSHEKRISPRIPCGLECTVKGVPGDIEVVNISEGGVFLGGKNLEALPLGKKIELLLHLPLEKEPFAIKARVVRKAAYGVGAVFEESPQRREQGRHVYNVLRHTLPVSAQTPAKATGERRASSLLRTHKGRSTALILASLKFTAAGVAAARAAVEMARDTGASVVIFHALDGHLEGAPVSDPRRRSAADEAHKRFETLVRPRLPDFERLEFHCEPGYPADAICQAATAFGADMVVIGCHRGKNMLNLDRVDIVGMAVFEKSPCKVMLVPYKED